MFIVGLTGGIASGKSTVASVFAEMGVPIIDADLIARQIVEPGTDILKNIHTEFGDDVILENGELNRERLGEIIFDNPSKRRKLNELTHPEIQKRIQWRIIHCFFEGHAFVVVDLPLLFETGSFLQYVYKVIVVTCEPEQQLERLIKRNSMSEDLAKKRISAQMPLEEKCARANYIIDNSGSIDNTQEQAQRLANLLKSSWQHWKVRAYVFFSFFATSAMILYVFIKAWRRVGSQYL